MQVDRSPTPRRRRAAAAVGLAGLGVAEVVAAARGSSLIDGMGRAIVDGSPRLLVDRTVALLGSHDKAAIRLSVGASTIWAAAGLARLPAKIRTPAVAALAAATAGATLRRPPRSVGAALAAAAAGAIATSVGLSRGPANARSELAWAVLGGGSLVAARTFLARRRHRYSRLIEGDRRSAQPDPMPSDGAEMLPGLAPLITPIDQFYVTDVNLGAPIVDPAGWRLAVTGLVGKPQRWSLNELAAEAESFDAVMVCVHNPVGGDRVGNGRWLGVPLQTILTRADASAHATTLVTRAVDGFTTSLPVQPLRSGDWSGYVVIGSNSGPLPARHGYPARVFVPGIYGQYTGVKWLTELELIAGPHDDYWAPRGWPHEPAWVQPQARIDVPPTGAHAGREVTVAGVAWAPPHGVAGVEVRTGQGPWRAADLARELAPSSWRRWRAALDLPPGVHTVQARTISQSGEVQEGRQRPPFPLGASGWHTVSVHVS
ncbi:molybdopterin-dependent oxidoreductase [Mycolicibacterium pyrenivorans]|uniref:molybdopterin-dependent oxidoreductase n=1 Tax=Mycolicibacterium pyrenivorans TaxID=187102 RepID=UPI0021F36647|nr:molybdopterin-dependent oxidoreductase [Mycolicibacterium pyrenivorans]MCV7153579.1 molybdopterin-dependent oxidoreductase [Mycolicibacterium pyrenivorans]